MKLTGNLLRSHGFENWLGKDHKYNGELLNAQTERNKSYRGVSDLFEDSKKRLG